jgi:hypothetical protein
MRANLNSSRELGLYPEIDLTRLSSSSAKRKAIGSRNRVRQPKITAEDDTRCNQKHVLDFGKQNQSY